MAGNEDVDRQRREGPPTDMRDASRSVGRLRKDTEAATWLGIVVMAALALYLIYLFATRLLPA